MSGRPRHYKLDREHKIAVPCDLLEWALAFEDNVVRQTSLSSGVHVSTVFLGLDHNWQMGADVDPILFETIVFSDRAMSETLGEYRYATWAEAEAHHDLIVEELKESTNAIR